MGRNDYIRYIEQALQRATPEQLTKIYHFFARLAWRIRDPRGLIPLGLFLY